MGSFATDESGTADGFSVVVIGAGITGLLIAQALTKAGIHCSVWEAGDSTSLDQPADWGMGIHWALPMLQECLPSHLMDCIQQAQTDSFVPAPESDVVPIHHGETGEPIKLFPIAKLHRVSRNKFRKLCSRDIPIHYNKRVIGIEPSENFTSVTAIFADGTMTNGSALVGADGARSVVRRQLLGIGNALPTAAPYVATRTVLRYATAQQAVEARKMHPINAMAIHPDGVWSWISILDVEDPEKPETWTFQLMTSWPRTEDDEDPRTRSNASLLADVKAKTSRFADPIRSANQWIPDGTKVNMNRVTYWQPIPWDNCGGTVTLAGDAAHPMTFHRGQGLNHAIADAARYASTIKEIIGPNSSTATNGAKKQNEATSAKNMNEEHEASSNGSSYPSNEEFQASRKNGNTGNYSLLGTAVAAYDAEIIARGGEEVRVSKINTEMVHQWDKLMLSPLMQKGSDRH